MVTFDSTDLDNASSESGVVHESVANNDHDNASKLKQGYSIANPYLSSNLVGYWPLQEDSGSTAYDFSGNNNDGSIVGAKVNQTGLLGTSSYSFDGTDDHVDTTYSGDFGTNAFSVSLWVNPDATDVYDDIIGNYDGQGWLIQNYKDKGAWRFFLNGNPDLTGGNTSKNEWTHLVCVADTDDTYIYENASQVKSGPRTGDVDSPSSVRIGERAGGGKNYIGEIAEVRIYDKALPSSEVQTLYDVVNTSGTLTTEYRSL